MKTYQDFVLSESSLQESKSMTDNEGDLTFGLSTNDDGVFFQIGDERFQTSKYAKAAVLQVLKSGGKWKGQEGGKQVGITVDGGMAYFRIGDEQFIMSNKGRRTLAAMFK